MSEDDRPAAAEPRGATESGDGGLLVRVDRGLDRLRAALDDRMPRGDAVTAAVLAVVALALLGRLYLLGRRVMHWDEVRVAYWILRWTRTGEFSYRPVIHGPFIQHVNHWTYAVWGTSNFVSRLPVALVGTALPLSALLFRERLSDRATLGLAVLLAGNPLLLYYSRFMRSDVLVAGFMFIALGFLVRLADTRRPRYLYLATAAVALGLASKENALVYPLCWVGMVAAVGGMELLYPRRFPNRSAFLRAIRERGRRTVDRATARAARSWVGHGLGAVGLFAAMTVFFFAPRGTPDGIWTGNVAGTLGGTAGAIERGFGRWAGSKTHADQPIPDCFTGQQNVLYDQFGTDGPFARDGLVFDYVCNLGREVGFLVDGAPVLVVLAIIGFVAALRSEEPGVLVPGAFAWGVASLLGYVVGSDIIFPPWLAVHAVVAFAIPAGVGLALLTRWARQAVDDDDVLDAVVAGGLVVLLVTAMAGDAVGHAYGHPYGTDEPTSIVQFAQPGGELEPALDAMQRTIPANDGVDVLVYGDDVADMRTGGTFEHPACVKWLSPLSAVSWTMYRTDANVTCVVGDRRRVGQADTTADVTNRTTLAATVERADPPVVISSVAQAEQVRPALPDEYVSARYRMYRSNSPERTIVIFFDAEQVADPPGTPGGG